MNFGIIAAGEGSRLADEGLSLPKPLVEVNGMPLIGRLLHVFAMAGADTVAVVTNASRPETTRYLQTTAPSLPYRLEIRQAITPSSMHTFAIVGDMLRGKGRFIATTVDTVFNTRAFLDYAAAYAAAPDDIDGIMAVTSFIDDEKPLYVSVDKDMDILGFKDREENPRYISAGIYGLGDKALDILDETLRKGVRRMRNYQRALVEAGLRLKAYDIGKAVDVDHAADISTAASVAGTFKDNHTWRK